VRLPNNGAFNRVWQQKYKPRINGKFRGTTDEIIQWASCKWGISDELTRARAVKESHWRQGTYGDYEARSRGHCTPGWQGNPCPTSFGLLQSKWYYRPGTYPRTRVSTAFMLDSALAETRGCLDGMMWFGSRSRGKVWDCVGVWYSGEWRSGYASYVSQVREIYRSKPWRRWAG
jgi:autotransporter family porin